VDGQPSARLIDGQAGYLAVALAPRDDSPHRLMPSWGRARSNLFHVKVVSEPELGPEILSAYDVIALCNVPRLAPEQWTSLEEFVKAGGGLLVALGGLVNVDHYNRFGFAEGRGLLPAPLVAVEDGPRNLDERLGFKPAPEGSLFADFAGHPTSGLFSARVDRYLSVGPESPQAQIPLRYSNDEPALVLSQWGRGRVALWTTSVNMEWSTLPGRGDFVTVMTKAVGAVSPQHGEKRNLMVGQDLAERLMPKESSLPLRIAIGESQVVEPAIVSLGADLAAQWGPLEKSGPITLVVGDERRDFAVNADPKEFALQPIDPGELDKTVDRPLSWMTENQLPEISRPGSAEWSTALMWIALAFLLIEIWLAQRFSTPLPVRHAAEERRSSIIRGRAAHGVATR